LFWAACLIFTWVFISFFWRAVYSLKINQGFHGGLITLLNIIFIFFPLQNIVKLFLFFYLSLFNKHIITSFSLSTGIFTLNIFPSFLFLYNINDIILIFFFYIVLFLIFFFFIRGLRHFIINQFFICVKFIFFFNFIPIFCKFFFLFGCYFKLLMSLSLTRNSQFHRFSFTFWYCMSFLIRYLRSCD
jgi:hypothetical protein